MIAVSASLFGVVVVGGIGYYAYKAAEEAKGRGKGTTGPVSTGPLPDAVSGAGHIETDAAGVEHTVTQGELGPSVTETVGQPQGPTPGVPSLAANEQTVGPSIAHAKAPAPPKHPPPKKPTQAELDQAYAIGHAASDAASSIRFFAGPGAGTAAGTPRAQAKAFTRSGLATGAIW
jgi:hypothetical protein